MYLTKLYFFQILNAAAENNNLLSELRYDLRERFDTCDAFLFTVNPIALSLKREEYRWKLFF